MMAFPSLEDVVVHEPREEARIQLLLQQEEHHMPPPDYLERWEEFHTARSGARDWIGLVRILLYNVHSFKVFSWISELIYSKNSSSL